MVDLILIAIIIFGFINSYTDFKHGRIKNVLIILMIVFGVSLNFLLNSFTLESVINSATSLAIGFFLFYSNYWSPGDAKLFFAFSLLLPISIYQFGKVSFFPSISILINTFIPVTIYYVLKSLPTLKLKNVVKTFKGQTNPKDFLSVILLLFGFPFVFNFFSLKLDVVSSTFIIFVIFFLMKNFQKKYSNALFGILSILNLFSDYPKILSAPYLIDFFISLFLYQTFSLVLSFLTTLSFSIPISIGKLRPGQILGEPLYRIGNSFFKKSKKGERITKLSEQEVSILKKMSHSGKLKFKSLLIERTVPFAPFLFIGVLLTYLLQGNIFSFAYLKYLKYLIKPIF